MFNKPKMEKMTAREGGVTIRWGFSDESFTIRRLVISSELPESTALQAEAARLNIPIVVDDVNVDPLPGDMWISLSPENDPTLLNNEMAAAHNIQAASILERLQQVQ